MGWPRENRHIIGMKFFFFFSTTLLLNLNHSKFFVWFTSTHWRVQDSSPFFFSFPQEEFGESKAVTAGVVSMFHAVPLLTGPIATWLTDRLGGGGGCFFCHRHILTGQTSRFYWPGFLSNWLPIVFNVRPGYFEIYFVFRFSPSTDTS